MTFLSFRNSNILYFLCVLAPFLFIPAVHAQEPTAIHSPQQFDEEDSNTVDVVTFEYDEDGRVINTVIEGSLPDVAVTDVQIEQQSGNHLVGSFTILNREDTYVAELQIELSIVKPIAVEAPEGDNSEPPLIDWVVYHQRSLSNNSVTLGSGESRVLPFSWDVPPLVRYNKYLFRIRVLTGDGRELGFRDEVVTLSGTDRFVSLQPREIIVEAVDPITSEEKQSWEPLEGPNIDSGAELAISGVAAGIGAATVHARPVAVTRRGLVQDPQEINVVEGEFLTIAPGEKQSIAVSLHAGMNPGVYDIDLFLEDDSGNRVSAIAAFHYVVAGPSASIISASIAQFGRTEGQTTTVRYSIAGPADRLSDMHGALRVEITNRGQVVGLKDIPVSVTAGSSLDGTVDITMLADACDVPAMNVVVLASDGQPLSVYKMMLDPSVVCSTETVLDTVAKQNSASRSYLVIIGAALVFLLLVAVAVVIYMRWKKRRDDLIAIDSSVRNRHLSSRSLMFLMLAIAVGVAGSVYFSRHEVSSLLVSFADARKPNLHPFGPGPRNPRRHSGSNIHSGKVHIFKACHNRSRRRRRRRATPTPTPTPTPFTPIPFTVSVEVVETCGHIKLTSSVMPYYAVRYQARYKGNNYRSFRESYSYHVLYTWSVEGPAPIQQIGDWGSNADAVEFETQIPGRYTIVLSVVVNRVIENRRGTIIMRRWGTGSVSKSITVLGDSDPNCPFPSPTSTPTPTPPPGTPQCSDGVDNDGDTFIDSRDPGCWTDITDPSTYDPNDDDEYHVPEEDPGGFGETD